MSPDLSPEISALLKDPDALIPAIAQDLHTREVLMLAYMNAESLICNSLIRSRHVLVAKPQ